MQLSSFALDSVEKCGAKNKPQANSIFFCAIGELSAHLCACGIVLRVPGGKMRTAACCMQHVSQRSHPQESISKGVLCVQIALRLALVYGASLSMNELDDVRHKVPVCCLSNKSKLCDGFFAFRPLYYFWLVLSIANMQSQEDMELPSPNTIKWRFIEFINNLKDAHAHHSQSRVGRSASAELRVEIVPMVRRVRLVSEE